MANILVIYEGRLAYTTSQAARRYGVQPASMRKQLDRLGIEPLPEPLDGRTPLYDAEQLDQAMRARPGKGANLRRDADPQ